MKAKLIILLKPKLSSKSNKRPKVNIERVMRKMKQLKLKP